MQSRAVSALQLPYYTSWVNSFRLCFFGVHAWVAIHLCVLVFSVDAELVKKGKLGYMVWDIKNYETAKAITDVSASLPGGGSGMFARRGRAKMRTSSSKCANGNDWGACPNSCRRSLCRTRCPSCSSARAWPPQCGCTTSSVWRSSSR